MSAWIALVQCGISHVAVPRSVVIAVVTDRLLVRRGSIDSSAN